MSNVYDALNGQSSLDAAVQRFQKRVTADPDLACHFDGMDLRRIMTHQVALLRLLLGEQAQDKRAVG